MTTLLINVAFLILLSSITGAIMVIIWYAIGLLLERIGFANIVFELLKMVVLFFLLPIAFVILKAYDDEVGTGRLFGPTPAIVSFCKWFVPLWGIGVVIVLTYIILSVFLVKYRFREAFSCPSGVQAKFDSFKREMHLESSPLQLVQSYRAEIPCTYGILTPRIVIPVEEYSDDELRVIILHEMTHYKQRDVVLKFLSYLMLMIHYFNPFAWMVFFKIQKWSEFVCDFRASKHFDKINSYFDVILRIAMEKPSKSGMVSHLAKSSRELKERARKLRRNNEMKRKSVFSMVLVLCTAFMLSSTSVYAATVECADAYLAIEQATSVEAAEPQSVAVTDGVTVEYGESHRLTIVEGEIIEQLRGAHAFAWDVRAGYRMYSPWFDCEAGDDLVVTVLVDPTNVSIRVGLEDSMGYRYYVVGSDTIAHGYDITSSGEYRIYVQNDSSTDVAVNGSYLIR